MVLRFSVALAFLLVPGCESPAGVAVDGAAPLDAATTADAGSSARDAGRGAPRSFDVWFTPNIGSVDMLDLFRRPEDWPTARARVDVVKLYSAQITAVEPAQCVMCGPNLRPALIDAEVFSTLDAWGIALATEAGVVKPGRCTAELTVPAATTALSIVEASSGTLAAIAMDEPYRGGEMEIDGVTCGHTMEQTAEQTAAWLSAVREAHPGLLLGDIEPYPYFSVTQLSAWLVALDRRGATLDFFHLDVDLNALKNQSAATTASDLETLRTLFAGWGIPFGVIVIGNEWLMNMSRDQPLSYYETSTAWAREIEAAIGAPDHVVVQSWVDSSGMGEMGSTRLLPVNLPETAAHTHTAILNEVWDELRIP